MNEFWKKQCRVTALFISLLTHIVEGHAQNACPTSPATETGTFTVQSRVCANTPVTITGVPGSLANVRYVYQYTGNGIPTGIPSTSNVYTAPGSYTILQVAAGPNATGTLACRVVEVLPTTPISFSVISCSNRLVTLTYLLDAQSIRYNTLNINWGDGTPLQLVVLTGSNPRASITHAYTGVATSFVINVTGSYTGACTGGPTAQRVNVPNTAASAPIIPSLISDDTKATIVFQGPTGFNTTLYRKSASGIFEPTSFTGTSSGSFAIPASPTTVSCYQLVALDVCGGGERRSAEVCSLAPVVVGEDKQNVVSWPAYAGTGPIRLYRVYKNGFPSFSGPTSPYTDNVNITCGTPYCYFLEASVGPTTIRSSTVCTTGKDNSAVSPPSSAFVSVQADGVKVQATLPTAGLPTPYTLVITRSDGGGSAFTPVGTSNDRSFVDQNAQTNSRSYCYQTAIRNACGTVSAPTSAACTILLTKNPNGALTWTQASPYSAGPPQAYQIIFIDATTGLSDKKPLGNVTTFQPIPQSQVTQYQVAAIDGNGVESYSNQVNVELGLSLFLPNAFAPAGSLAKNQSFMAEGVRAFWNTFEMTIYSRWGDVVFNTTDKDSAGWTGDLNGAPALPGFYGYRVRLTDAAGTSFERTGQVLLIR